MSEATTELVLDLDTSEAEVSLEAFEKAMEGLQETVSGFSKTLQKSLGLLQASLHKTVAGVNALNKSVQSLMQQMSKGQSEYQLAEGISTAIEGISVFATVIKPAKKAMEGIVKAIGEYAEAVKFAAPESGTLAAVFPKLSGMLVNLSTIFKGSGGKILGVLSKFGPKIAVVVAIATVAIGAITALVANWDKISNAIQTFVTETLPQAWSQVTQLFQSIAAVITPVVNEVQGLLQVCLDDIAGGFSQMLEAMRPLAEFVGNVFLTVFELLRQVFTDTRIFAVAEGSALGDLLQAIADFATQLWEQLRLALANIRSAMETEGTSLGNLFRIIGDAVANLWKCVGPILEGLWLIFDETFQSVGRTVGDIVGVILGAVSGLVTMLSGIFTGDWSVIWEGMGQVCKNAVNGIIGVLNLLLSGLTGALNGVFKLLNKVSVEVPDWVPGMGW